MKHLIVLLIFASAFYACDSDDNGGNSTGTLELVFKATYDEAPLVMNESYAYGDQRIRINTSSYFLSDLEIANAGIQLDLFDIVKIDHTSDVTEADALEGQTLTITGVPASTYSNLSFGVGVSPELNATAPIDYGPDHPLSQQSDYWTPWESYIFSKLEGRLDTAGQNTYDLTFIYHSGKDELYQTFDRPVNIQILPDQTTRVEVIVDHHNLLVRNGTPLDIAARPTAHSAGDLEYPRYLLENFIVAVIVNQL